MIDDTSAWRADLMRTGLIVQDGDLDADPDQADKDCRRYVELVDMVDGVEGREVFDSLLASMQVPEDYEVYEATFRAVGRFKSPDVGEWIFDGWWSLRERSADHAWILLNQLARGGFGEQALRGFSRAWSEARADQRDELLRLITGQERDGWLSYPAASGQLRPLTPG